MKIKAALLCFFVCAITNLHAQTTIETTKIVQAEKPIYFGGGIVLGGGSGSFQLGINPELIKSYNQYIDLGLVTNFYFTSYKSTDLTTGYNYKSSNTQFGLGGIARIWPANQVFIQLQPEYNWTWTHGKNLSQGTSGASNVSAPSFLAGLGYGKRNENGFSYFSILFDLVNDTQSPYRMGQLRAQPIFRAGFGFPIHFTKTKRLK